MSLPARASSQFGYLGGAGVIAPSVADWAGPAQLHCDAEFRIVAANPVATVLLGASNDALIGRRMIDLVVAGDRLAMMPLPTLLGGGGTGRRPLFADRAVRSERLGRSDRAVRSGRAMRDSADVTGACTVRRGDGTTIPVRVAVSPSSEGRHAGMTSTATLIPLARVVAAEVIPLASRGRHAASETARPVMPERVPPEPVIPDAAPPEPVMPESVPPEPVIPDPADAVPARTSATPPGRDDVDHIDSLTGLSTRARLMVELDRVIHSGRCHAILLIDLDGFKSINDTYGHDIGDEALVQMADRLRAAVRPDDLVVRFGGDEFVIACQSREAAVTIADRIVASLAEPLVTASGWVTVTASVGISDASIPAPAATDLLTRADAAMYAAKAAGKNQYRVYDEVLHAQMISARRTEQLLRSAVPDGRLVVYYQPIVHTTDRSVIGVEAVVRLRDEDGKLHLPEDFLAVAERSGLINTIDAWMLGESCRCIAAANEELGRPLSLSVNVSERFMTRSDFASTVMRAVEAAELDPSLLMLELSECALMTADSATLTRVAKLREYGVHIAVDNFGTGHASLGVLARLPLTYVKVDRRCVAGLLTSTHDAAVVEAITWLTHRLGLTWIAQGIETSDQWQAVQRFGPGLAQGYLFSHPVAAPELLRVLRSGAPMGPGSGAGKRGARHAARVGRGVGGSYGVGISGSHGR